MCIRHEKQVIVVCGVNKVPQEEFEEKYIESEREKIEIFDLVSRYGQEGSMTRTEECLSDLCNNDIQRMFRNDVSGF